MSEAETAIISACLKSNELVDDLIVSPEWFASPSNKRAWLTIVDLRKAGKAADIVSVGSITSLDMSDYLYSDGSDANVETYLGIVQDAWRKRELVKLADNIKLGTLSASADDVVTDIKSKLIGIEDTAIAVDVQQIGKSAHDALDALRAAEKSGVIGIKTGFVGLDKTVGNFRTGQVVFIAARPGCGKSSLGFGMLAGAAEHGEPGLGFSLEMPRQEVSQRLLSSFSGVDASRLRDVVLDAGHWDKLAEAKRKLDGLDLFIDDTPGITLQQIRLKCRTLDTQLRKRGKRLKLIIIDYVQIVGPDDPKESQERQLSKLGAGLKNLAKEMDILVIALSQLNRSLESRDSKKPTLADMRGSGGLEESGDIVIGVYRDFLYNPMAQPFSAELILLKVRNGAPHTFKCSYDGHLVRFRDATPAELATMGAR